MRNQTVDIAKGITGILMVLGHAMAFRYTDGWLLQLTHLSTSLFIFLSGIFLNIDRPWSDSLIRKADGLLKPYLVILLVLGIVYAVLGGLVVLPYLIGVLYATGPTIALVSLWFLPHLFLCFLVGVAVLQFCRRIALPRYAYVLLLLFLLVAGQRSLDIVWQQPLQQAWWKTMLRPAAHWPGLPWSLDVLPLTLAFQLAGYIFSSRVKIFRFQWLPVLLVLSVIVLLVNSGYAVIDINLRIYRDPVFTTLFVFCGIYMVLSMAAVFSYISLLAAGLAYIGKNFLVVLLFHLLVLRVLFRQVVIWIPDYEALHVPLMFIGGLLISLLLVILVHRIRWLSLLLLPMQSRTERHSREQC